MYDETAEEIRGYSAGYRDGLRDGMRESNVVDIVRVMSAKIEELEDKHWEECRQIALYDDEVKNGTHKRHGHWRYYKDKNIYECSCCTNKAKEHIYPFCMWCGAMMDGGDFEEQET